MPCQHGAVGYCGLCAWTVTVPFNFNQTPWTWPRGPVLVLGCRACRRQFAHELTGIWQDEPLPDECVACVRAREEKLTDRVTSTIEPFAITSSVSCPKFPHMHDGPDGERRWCRVAKSTHVVCESGWKDKYNQLIAIAPETGFDRDDLGKYYLETTLEIGDGKFLSSGIHAGTMEEVVEGFWDEFTKPGHFLLRRENGQNVEYRWKEGWHRTVRPLSAAVEVESTRVVT